jgi:hypothetical protein
LPVGSLSLLDSVDGYKSLTVNGLRVLVDLTVASWNRAVEWLQVLKTLQAYA